MQLKIKKLEAELLHVNAAKASQEVRILELLDEIKRIESAIEIQVNKEISLKKEIEEIKGSK